MIGGSARENREEGGEGEEEERAAAAFAGLMPFPPLRPGLV